MSYFAQPVLGRDQRVLIPTTLDDAVSDDHEVRILDEILRTSDWSEWEGDYCQVRGQPPIRPRILAGVILYGLMRRIRSSRVLEYMTGHNIDFMWLTEGRTIDHTTICKFRTRFKKQLRELFRHIGRMAMRIGLIRLGEVTFDGTRVKASNSRFKTWTADDVEKRLAELVDQFGQLLDEADKTDASEDEQFGLSSESPLPPELIDAKARHKKLQEALQDLRAAEAVRRRKSKIDPTENPAQMPSTDIDSKVLPNKEGGFAPNYTPVAAVDTHSDFIVFADVISHPNENTQTVAMVDQVKEDFGEQPQAVLTDSLNCTGPNIAAMEDRKVEFFSPMVGEKPATNPVERPNPREPISESLWPELPLNPQTKKIDKVCFLYDEELDLYYCPQGKQLEFEKTTPEVRQGQKITTRIYRCPSCEGCAFKDKCMTEENKHGRTIRRDIYTKLREQHAAKMQTTEARKKYERRFHAGETPFGWLKHVLGLRQFLLRGLENVRTEWLWACTAYNIRKLILKLGRLRALVEESTIAMES